MRWSSLSTIISLFVFETRNDRCFLEKYYFKAKTFRLKKASSCNCQRASVPLAILSEFESQRLEKFYSWLEGSWCVTSGTTARDLWSGVEKPQWAGRLEIGKSSSHFQESTMFSWKGQGRVKLRASPGRVSNRVQRGQSHSFCRLVGDFHKVCSLCAQPVVHLIHAFWHP